MNWPFVGRRFGAAEIIAGEVLHDQSIVSDTAGADIRNSDKRICAGNTHADVAIAVGHAFMIENAAGHDELLLHFFELGGIEAGYIVAIYAHEISFTMISIGSDPQLWRKSIAPPVHLSSFA